MPELYIGKRVIYRWRSGQVRGGTPEAAADVTRINADGSVNLAVIIDMARDAPMTLSNIAQQSEAVPSNCWRFTPDDYRLDAMEAWREALDGKRAKSKAA